MCSGSEAGLYSRLIDFVYHSTLGLKVIKKKVDGQAPNACVLRAPRGSDLPWREAGPPYHLDDKVGSDQ